MPTESSRAAAIEQTHKHKMTLSLPSDLEIQLTRSFDAPRELVFETWTKPEHVQRWWGCRSSSLPVCEIDLRPGGAWRYVNRMPDGAEHPFRGEFLEVDPPERLVHTSVYDVEPFNQYPATITVLFAEKGGVTTVTEITKHMSQEGRDAHLNSGMEGGAVESFDRLAELIHDLGAER